MDLFSKIPLITIPKMDLSKYPSVEVKFSPNNKSIGDLNAISVEKKSNALLQSEVNNNLPFKEESWRTIQKLLVQRCKELEAKQKLIQNRMTLRIQDVEVLHKKLFNKLEDQMKCQKQYNEQRVYSIESSKAVWEMKLFSCQLVKNASNMTRAQPFTDSAHEEAEKLKEECARELVSTTNKRLDALKEVIATLSQELENAKEDCLRLNGELNETTKYLMESTEMLNHFNAEEDATKKDSNAASCGLSSSLKEEPNTNPSSYLYQPETQIRGYVIEQTTLYPCVRLPNTASKGKSIRNPLRRVTDSRQSLSSLQESRLSSQDLAHIKSSLERSDCSAAFVDDSTSSECELAYDSRKELTSTFTNVPPKKRGRPRKDPMQKPTLKKPSKVIVFDEMGNIVKRKRGRPPKYLKIDLNSSSLV